MFHLDVSGKPEAKQTLAGDKLAAALRDNAGGVRLRHVVVEGPVDLNAVEFGHEWVVHDCTFLGPIRAVDAVFTKSVDLSRSTFNHYVNFAGCRIDGSLLLRHTEFRRFDLPPNVAVQGVYPLDVVNFGLLKLQGNLVADGLKSGLKVNLNGSRIRGDANFANADLTGGLNFEVAIIEGSLLCPLARIRRGKAQRFGAAVEEGSAFLSGIKVTGQVNFRGAHIDNNLVLYSADVHCGVLCGVENDRCTQIGGDALLMAARIAFDTDFSHAHITGNLSLQNAKIDGDLLCERAQIVRRPAADAHEVADHGSQGGNAYLPGVLVSGKVDFRGARVDADFHLQSAVIKGGLYCRALETPTSLDCPEGTRTTIGRNVWLAAATVAGGLDFSGAEVGGDFNLDGATVEGGVICRPWQIRFPQDGAATTDRGFVPMHVAGSALMSASKVLGVVDFSGGRVDGDLKLDSADVKNGLYLLALREGDAVVGGDVVLSAAKISGGVDLAGARVGRHLRLEGAIVEGRLNAQAPEGRTTEIGGDVVLAGVKVLGSVYLNRVLVKNLDLRGASIEGNLAARQVGIGGRAQLSEAKVAGQIDLGKASIQEDLILQGSRIEGRLSCPQTRVNGRVDLRACQVRNAELGLIGPERVGVRGPALPPMRIEGFQFQELALGDRESGVAQNYHDLLRASESFEVSTYFLIERWLRNRGEDDQANAVYLAMRKERRRHIAMNPFARFLDRLFDFPIYLAMRFNLLFFAFAFLVALGTVVFNHPDAAKPDPQSAAVKNDVAMPYTVGDAFWVSLQANLPIAQIPVAHKWELMPRPIWLPGLHWLQYDSFGSLLSMLGYVIVPLFVAGVANTWLREKSGK